MAMAGEVSSVNKFDRIVGGAITAGLIAAAVVRGLQHNKWRHEVRQNIQAGRKNYPDETIIEALANSVGERIREIRELNLSVTRAEARLASGPPGVVDELVDFGLAIRVPLTGEQAERQAVIAEILGRRLTSHVKLLPGGGNVLGTYDSPAMYDDIAT